MKYDFDVMIAGGGMVGASLAVMFAASAPALKIAIVERFPADQSSEGEIAWQPSFDARATALSSGSEAIFRRMGIWQQIAQNACAISTVHVSQRGHWGSVSLQAHEHGVQALGYIVENAWLGRVLLAHLRALPAVSIISPAKVAAIVPANANAGADADGVSIDVDANGGWLRHQED